VKDTAAKTPPKPAVLSLAQLLTEQPAAPPPGWIEPGLLPPQGILFVGGEPKVGKSLLVANLALALAAGKDRAGFRIPAARRVLVCQFELPTPQFVSRLASMRRSVGAAADQNLLVDTRAGGNLLSAPQGLNHFLNAARQAAAEVKADRSHSAIKKARTHLKAMFDLAVDDRILDTSPARRITMPKRIRKVDDTYADQAVVRKLFQAAGQRDRILLRIFVSCGLRPQETFALRANDIEGGRLRVDEALKQAERGAAFIGEPETRDSYGYVSLPAKLESELRAWVRDEGITPEGWLFAASRGGGPIRPNNYVKRDFGETGRGRRCRQDRSQAPAPDLRDLPARRGNGPGPTPALQRRNHQAALPESNPGRAEGASRKTR